MSRTAYNKCMRSLNQKQKEVVLHHRKWCKKVVACHKRNKPIEPYHMFLSGPGGVGKSFVIKMIYHDSHTPQTLSKYHHWRHTYPINSIYRSSSLQHWWYDSTLGVFPQQPQKNEWPTHGPVCRHCQHIVDPTWATACSHHRWSHHRWSMMIDAPIIIGASILNQIHHHLQEIKQMKYTNTRFGNVTITAVGDLYQLPPFRDNKIYAVPGSRKNPSMEMLHGSLWTESFELHELKDVVRQKDKNFISLLNEIRKGNPQKLIYSLPMTFHHKTSQNQITYNLEETVRMETTLKEVF